MNRLLHVCMMIVTVVAVATAPAVAFAQPAPVTEASTINNVERPVLIEFGAALGAGLIVIGAGYGIGKIGAAAMDGISRQPEAAKDIGSNMILAAALVEGAVIIGLGVCFLKG